MAKESPDQSHFPTPQRIEDVAGHLRLAGDPSRLKILMLLDVEGEMNVGKMAAILGISPSTLSARLMSLRISGIVFSRRSGTTMQYALTQRGRILTVATKALLQIDAEGPVP